jgi:hypothetical protein
MSSNRPSQTARVTALIAGSTKHLSSVTSVTLGGTTYTATSLMQALQSVLQVYADVDAARAALKAKLLVEKNQAGTNNAFVSACTVFVRSHFGNVPDVLADFGLAPKKARKPLTVEAKARKVEQGLATRTARHTMGKRQKAEIKGVVPEPATSGKPAAPPIALMSPMPGETPAPKQ